MEKTFSVKGFYVASRNADIKTARELLEHVDPSSLLTMWEGRTCFHVAVISGDSDLFRELAAKLPVQDLKNIIKMPDKKGDTALHLAVRKTHLDLVKRLVDLDANLCECVNKERETPLKLAVSLGFKEAVKLFMTRTSNALHCVVELNQVKLVQYLIDQQVQLSEHINRPYHRITNPPDTEESCAKCSSDNGGNSDTNPQPDQHTKERGPINECSDGGEMSSQSNAHSRHNQQNHSIVVKGDTPLHIAVRNKDEHVDQHTKERGPINESSDGGEKSWQTKAQQNHPIVVEGDTPLHIAARNKFEHMLNLLLKVPGVEKQAKNSEEKTAFDIAREVTEYHESFRVIRKLAEHSILSPKAVMMDYAPRVTNEKMIKARTKVNEAYIARRDAELVVAGLLATMTCAAAFTVPGGFESKNVNDRGSPNLISLTSFKLFLIFDCIAFFLSLFVCIMWEMSSELTTGDKMLFMTVNTLVVCFSFGFTAYGFMCAVYVMLERKVKTFSWVVLGCLIAIILWAVVAFIHQSIQFAVKRARFHRLCGVCSLFDDIVERIWNRAACCGLITCLRSGDDVSQDLITGHAMCTCRGLLKLFRSNGHEITYTGPARDHEEGMSLNNSPFNMYQLKSRSASPLINRI